MNLKHLLGYQVWADEVILNALDQVSDDHFNKSFENIRSLRALTEHHINGYDYLIVPFDKLKDRMRELSTMSRVELISAWESSQAEFSKKAEGLGEEISLPVNADKTMTLPRDNYILLYTDHLTYHRAQFTQSMKLLGYEGVNTDYYSFAAQK